MTPETCLILNELNLAILALKNAIAHIDLQNPGHHTPDHHLHKALNSAVDSRHALITGNSGRPAELLHNRAPAAPSIASFAWRMLPLVIGWFSFDWRSGNISGHRALSNIWFFWSLLVVSENADRGGWGGHLLLVGYTLVLSLGVIGLNMWR